MIECSDRADGGLPLLMFIFVSKCKSFMLFPSIQALRVAH